MKRTFGMLLVLFLIYLTLQVIEKFVSDGHFVEYSITTDSKVFSIKETFTNNSRSNYLFEIKNENNTFYFQTYHNFNKGDKIVKDIKYTEFGSYKCLLPIFFGDKTVLDITCFEGKLIYDYADLVGKNRDLDNWVNSLSSVYSVSKFKDDLTNNQITDKTIVYPANVLSNHYLAVENYKGLQTVNKVNMRKMADVIIFERDQYAREVSTYLDKYYITADYTSEKIIERFFVVDFKVNKKTVIQTNKEISFDSYIMGDVDGSVYLYDKTAKKQYQINIKTQKVIEVGNKEVGIKFYNNGDWIWIDFNDFKPNLVFDEVYLKTDEYARVDSVLGEDGLTYYYAKNGKVYDVFVAPSRFNSFKKYAFSIDNLDSVIYLSDYVYFKNNETIYYYHSSRGLRALYKNPELKFNQALKFGVYINK